jgi:hypothetical protein
MQVVVGRENSKICSLYAIWGGDSRMAVILKEKSQEGVPCRFLKKKCSLHIELVESGVGVTCTNCLLASVVEISLKTQAILRKWAKSQLTPEAYAEIETE